MVFAAFQQPTRGHLSPAGFVVHTVSDPSVFALMYADVQLMYPFTFLDDVSLAFLNLKNFRGESAKSLRSGES